MTETTPNFVHLGPDKSGSTWLHETLVLHPEVFLTRAKDLYFFNRYYDRGADWYLAQFRQAGPEHRVVGEVCPEYLACPDAPERIRETLGGDVRLMVTLREPAERAFSSFLYMRKHGLAPATFREAVGVLPDLIDHGRYASQLGAYLKHFDRDALHVALFDDLRHDPQGFLHRVTDWLGVSRRTVDEEQLAARLTAGRARSVHLARLARQASAWVRRQDGADVVGIVKRSPIVQRLLYRPFEGGDLPSMRPEDESYVHEQLADEVAGVEAEFGLPLRSRWGW